MHISIHAAREGGDLGVCNFASASGISIHAAREGGDSADFAVQAAVLRFQSTPPVKAATGSFLCKQIGQNISIHAAREGGDVLMLA